MATFWLTKSHLFCFNVPRKDKNVGQIEDTKMPEIDWIAVLAATIASFAVGALWYSPLLFAKPWQRETGLSDEEIGRADMRKTFAGAFILTFLAALAFAAFLGPNAGLVFGASAGFAAGLFWVAGALGVNYLFEQRSLRLWLINGGYNVATFTVIGAIIGAMA